ncbi:MAG: nitrilase-related carbon-nitrogen hydrolase, partial [Candidatus Sericytochromatia bacterium]
LGKIGGLICYESIFPEIISSSVNDGAELLTLVTNDSWYKDSSAVYQHNGQAVFRAIENDRYMVRGANTGISSVVSPEGRTLALLEPMKKGYITSKVKFKNTKTIYTQIGDIFVGFVFVILIIFLFISKKNKNFDEYGESY